MTDGMKIWEQIIEDVEVKQRQDMFLATLSLNAEDQARREGIMSGRLEVLEIILSRIQEARDHEKGASND